MWLELMEKGDCAYFRELLSSYRCHNDQEGQSSVVILRSRVEWFRSIAEYYEKNMFFSSLQDFRSALSQLIRDADSMHQHPLFQQPEIQQTAEWNEYQELLKIAREIVAA